LAGFLSIWLIHTNAVLGFLYAYMFFAGITIYLGLFQFAYKTTPKHKELVKMMETVFGGLANPEEKKYWARVLISTPRMNLAG